MWKKIFLILAKKLVNAGFNLLYNYIDKDKDGKLSKKEIDSFISDITKKLSRLKNKSMR